MFFNLVQNEWMKTNSKKQMLWFQAIFAVFILLIAVVVSFFSQGMAADLTAVDYASFVNTGLGMFIGIFAYVIGAVTITDEFKDGTIKQLLIRPASRTLVLLSKYVNVILVLICTYALLILFALLVGALFFGISTGEVTLGSLLKSIMYSLPNILFGMTLSFALAVLFKNLSIAISIAIVSNFIGGLLVALAGSKPWVKYIIYANLDLEQYDVANPLAGPLFPGMSLGFSLTVIFVYIVTLLLLSILVFKRRDIL